MELIHLLRDIKPVVQQKASYFEPKGILFDGILKVFIYQAIVFEMLDFRGSETQSQKG